VAFGSINPWVFYGFKNALRLFLLASSICSLQLYAVFGLYSIIPPQNLDVIAL